MADDFEQTHLADRNIAVESDILKNNTSKKDKIFESITDQLFDEVKREYNETKKLSDELLSALNNVFQTPLLPALDLVDNRSVTVITCPAGRSLYQVLGSSGTPYTCFKSSMYCSCPSYRFSVLKKEDQRMCKHLLAAKLSEAMDICKAFSVSNDEMTNMLVQLD